LVFHGALPMTSPAPQRSEHTTSLAQGASGKAAVIDAAEAAALPTSFGVFKPVGHVMIGLPTRKQLEALVIALHAVDWPDSDMRQFAPQQAVEQLQAMVDNAGILSGAGYEITLLRRYLDLAKEGTTWLLVKADDGERASTVGALAVTCGATIAEYYQTLAVESLIPLGPHGDTL
jgi:hypothetical protein